MWLVSFSLDAHGRLPDDLVTGLAVRGLLLVDPALRDRMRDVGDAIEIDHEPTGFAPADRLLAAAADASLAAQALSGRRPR